LASMRNILKKFGSAAYFDRLLTLSAALFVVSALMLVIASGLCAAEAPEWSNGFPRLADENVLLQWGPVLGATEYKVYRTETADKNLKLLTTAKVNRHIDKGVPDGKRLYYYVTAVIGGKEGPRSAAGKVDVPKKQVFVPLTVPKLVGGLVKPLPEGKVAVGIRWEDAAGTDLIGINIYRSDTKGKGYVMIGTSPGTSFEDTDVQRGKTYYYAVTSVDSNFKETKRSNEISVEVPELKAPKPTAETPSTEMLSAKPMFTITGYTVYGTDSEGKETKTDAKFGTVHDVVADDAVGRIYVSDYGYRGVLVYDLDGKFQFGIRRDGKDGKEKFANPLGLAIGPGGQLYVADYDAPEVRVYDIAGKLIQTINVDLSYIPQFEKNKAKARIYDVVVNKEGNVYACDPVSNRLHVYDYRGKRIFDSEIDKDVNNNFHGPTFMTLDRDGNIVIVDSGGSRLTVYSADGKFVRSISNKGFNAGQLNFPSGITLDKDGNVLVASGTTPNIQAFDPKTGKFLYALCNEKCDGPIPSGSMRGIYVDGKNRLYIAESSYGKVAVYQLGDKLVDIKPE
jgi:fibronectin type 3 domain-containing protein